MFDWFFDLFNRKSYNDYVKEVDRHSKPTLKQIKHHLDLNNKVEFIMKSGDNRYDYILHKDVPLRFNRQSKWSGGFHEIGTYPTVESFYELFSDDIIAIIQPGITFSSRW